MPDIYWVTASLLFLREISNIDRFRDQTYQWFRMENAFERESGSRNVSESSDQHGEASSPRGRKRYQRHNPQQIQRLER